LFKTEVDTIQQNQGVRKWLKVQWAPETGQFQYKVDPQAQAVSVFDIGSALENDRTNTVIGAIKRTNLALSSVKSVMDQDGADITKQMDILMKTMNFDQNTKGQGTVMEALVNSVRDWFKAEENPAPADGEPRPKEPEEPDVLGEVLEPGPNDEPVSETGKLSELKLAEIRLNQMLYDRKLSGGAKAPGYEPGTPASAAIRRQRELIKSLR
jgi:hypothetical protein